MFYLVPASPLDRKTSVVFLLDASSGVSKGIYREEKAFIRSLASHFNISPKGPRGSLVMYATNPYTLASFVDPDLTGRLDIAPLLRQPRRMDRALEHAPRLISTLDKDTRKIVILLTAGRQAQGAKPLGEAIKPLRQLGAQTFVVAIGRGPDARKLAPLVDRTNDLFQVPSVGDLQLRSRPIAKHIRDKPGR